MNQELKELKELAAWIEAAGNDFCRKLEEYDRQMEEEHRTMMRILDTVADNYKRVNMHIDAIRSHQGEKPV